jgi:hypothetical protein
MRISVYARCCTPIPHRPRLHWLFLRGCSDKTSRRDSHKSVTGAVLGTQQSDRTTITIHGVGIFPYSGE